VGGSWVTDCDTRVSLGSWTENVPALRIVPLHQQSHFFRQLDQSMSTVAPVTCSNLPQSKYMHRTLKVEHSEFWPIQSDASYAEMCGTPAYSCCDTTLHCPTYHGLMRLLPSHQKSGRPQLQNGHILVLRRDTRSHDLRGNHSIRSPYEEVPLWRSGLSIARTLGSPFSRVGPPRLGW
jgi:hypothetical protein